MTAAQTSSAVTVKPFSQLSGSDQTDVLKGVLSSTYTPIIAAVMGVVAKDAETIAKCVEQAKTHLSPIHHDAIDRVGDIARSFANTAPTDYFITGNNTHGFKVGDFFADRLGLKKYWLGTQKAALKDAKGTLVDGLGAKAK